MKLENNNKPNSSWKIFLKKLETKKAIKNAKKRLSQNGKLNEILLGEKIKVINKGVKSRKGDPVLEREKTLNDMSIIENELEKEKKIIEKELRVLAEIN